jgi:CBS domain-containing protein
MKIKDRKEYLTKRPPLSFSAKTKVCDAVAEMAAHNYGCVVVTDKNRHVKGIVSERDFLRRLLYEGMDQQKATLGQIMTKHVRVANENDQIVEWLRIMSNERFRHLPVVDEKGHLKSLISQGDLVSYTWPILFKHFREQARESLKGGYEIVLIVAGILLYAISLPIIYMLFF